MKRHAYQGCRISHEFHKGRCERCGAIESPMECVANFERIAKDNLRFKRLMMKAR